ncbi:MAG: FxsA family protein [Polyangiaceae bacterium]|nr:FxsA family protein [Polyangiaceae bacterium]
MIYLFFIFLSFSVAEVFVFYEVAQRTGALTVLGLCIISSIAGIHLAKAEMRRVWNEFVTAYRGGKVPEESLVETALIVAAGVLLFLPGFLSDGLGILLLLPHFRRRLGVFFRRLWAAKEPPEVIPTSGVSAPASAPTVKVISERSIVETSGEALDDDK